MAIEIKQFIQMAKRNVLFRLAVLIGGGVFLYLIYGLYQETAGLFVFQFPHAEKTDSLLQLLTKNIAPLTFYLFGLFLGGDIFSNFLGKLNLMLRIRDKGSFKMVAVHFIMVILYSLLVVLGFCIFQQILNIPITFEGGAYALSCLALLLLITTFFNLMGWSALGYVLDIIILTILALVKASNVIVILIFIISLIIFTGLNYLAYKNKEVI